MSNVTRPSQAKVNFYKHHNPLYGEISIRVKVDGVLNEDRTYYCDDVDDANRTKAAMVAEEKANPTLRAPVACQRKELPGTAVREINESLDNITHQCRIIAADPSVTVRGDCLVGIRANLEIIREFNNNPNE